MVRLASSECRMDLSCATTGDWGYGVLYSRLFVEQVAGILSSMHTASCSTIHPALRLS